MNIGEFFGTLQEAITTEWRKHLQTGKYSKHMALDDFYKEMPEKVDALIEAWQADNDIVEDYSNALDGDMDALEYMEALKKFVANGCKEFFADKSELESLTDDILALIDSTIYKLKHLTESSPSLSDYLHESLSPLFESVLDVNLDIKISDLMVGAVQDFCDHVTPAGGTRYGNIDTDWFDDDFTDHFKDLAKNGKKMSAAKFKNELNESSFIVIKCPQYHSEFIKGHYDFYVTMPKPLENAGHKEICGVYLSACPDFVRVLDPKQLTSARGCQWVEFYKIPTDVAEKICRICDTGFKK